MRCFDKFKNKMSYSGGSLREEQIHNSRKLLMETFENDASFQTGIVMWKLGMKNFDHSPTIPIRFYEKAFSNANGSTVKFQTPYNIQINVGDIIYNKKSEEFYICTEVFDIDEIHWQGKFTLCNWILKWQKENGEILEYPCYAFNSTQYNSGEQSNKQFTIGSSQHMVTLPSDENTIKLATPKRFILDKNLEKPTVFIVTQNDSTSYNYGKKGLTKITLYENVFNPDTDRADLGICDYIDVNVEHDHECENKPVPIKPTKITAVIDCKTNIIKSGGSIQTFTGKFIDVNGNEIKIGSCVWDIICDFYDSLIIEKIDNQLKIGIDNDTFIDEDFKINLSDESGKYSASLIVRIESLL